MTIQNPTFEDVFPIEQKIFQCLLVFRGFSDLEKKHEDIHSLQPMIDSSFRNRLSSDKNRQTYTAGLLSIDEFLL